MVGDVHADVIDVRIAGGKPGEKSALAAAQLQVKRLPGPGKGLSPAALVPGGVVHVKRAGRKLRPA